MTSAVLAHCRASSETTSTLHTVSRPGPPYSSGTFRAVKPISAIFSMISLGMRSSRSISAAMGASSDSAKSRASCWIIC